MYLVLSSDHSGFHVSSTSLPDFSTLTLSRWRGISRGSLTSHFATSDFQSGCSPPCGSAVVLLSTMTTHVACGSFTFLDLVLMVTSGRDMATSRPQPSPVPRDPRR